MTDRQENKRSMYLAVQRVCNRDNSVWSGLTAFAGAFGDFEDTITNIETQRLIQEGRTTGIAENKQKEEDEMIQKTTEVAASVYAYAADNDDNALMQKVNYSPSDLRRSRDTILKDICQLVHDETDKVVTNLADYGIVDTDLTDLQKEIDDFANIIAEPRTATGTRATATSQLVQLIIDGDSTLKDRMDKLVEQFKTSDRRFYRSYKSARIIVDLGVRHEDDDTPPTE